MTIMSDYALSIPHPYSFKNANECSNSLTLDGTKINELSYQKLGASIPLSR